MNEIITGLDVGTSKVCAVIASVEENNKINILGVGMSPSGGLSRGNVVNIELTANAIKKAVSIAENQSGIRVRKVIAGIAGPEITGIVSKSTISTKPPHYEITESDVERLIYEAQNIKVPSDKSILYAMPMEFEVDNVSGIKNPVGLAGIRVEARVHILLANVTALENLRRCINRAGLEVDVIIPEPIASAYSVLEPEEKEIGVALVDIGAGTTDVAVFEEGVLVYTGSLPIAGTHITNDIRKAFGLQREKAEELKQTEGYAFAKAIVENKTITVPGIGSRGPRQITRDMLCSVIQPRVEEIFELLYERHLKGKGFLRNLSAGIVLTGGSSLLKGISELAHEMFGMPVRVGIPKGFSGGLVDKINNPMFSTSAGLVLFKADMEREVRIKTSKQIFFKRLISEIKRLFSS